MQCWLTAMREFQRVRSDQKTWQYLHKCPSLFVLITSIPAWRHLECVGTGTSRSFPLVKRVWFSILKGWVTPLCTVFKAVTRVTASIPACTGQLECMWVFRSVKRCGFQYSRGGHSNMHLIYKSHNCDHPKTACDSVTTLLDYWWPVWSWQNPPTLHNFRHYAGLEYQQKYSTAWPHPNPYTEYTKPGVVTYASPV